MFHVPNECRVRSGILGSDYTYGNNGVFEIEFDARTPNWKEMCHIKDLFWDSEDCVVQYHPPQSEYVNNHEYTLHLWRPIDQDLPMPPSILVGLK